MSALSVAEAYHQATKYDPASGTACPSRIDWSRQPLPFKEYPGARRVPLGRFLPETQEDLGDRQLRGRDRLDASAVGLNDLSHLLYFSGGVTEIVGLPGGPRFMRAAPSAGALYPTEIYVVSRGRTDLADGVYNYQVRTHALACAAEGDRWPELEDACFDHPALEGGDLAIVLAGVYQRSAWRYGERAYRRILLDTGHVLGNLVLYAPLVDRRAVPIGGFADASLNACIGLDVDAEAALVVLTLPRGPGRFEPVALPSSCGWTQAGLVTGMEALHQASCIPAGSRPAALPPAVLEPRLWLPDVAGERLEGPRLEWLDDLSKTLLERRSARAFSGVPCTRAQLATVLYHACSPPGLFDPARMEIFVAIHRVAGLDPGCYHYDPATSRMRQVRSKDLRAEVQFLCLDQELGRAAAAVVFHAADLGRAVARWGERAYRYLHLDAGHVGERLNLGALHVGLGASGIGGFYDDQVNDRLGIPGDLATLYITALGVPLAGPGGS